MSIIKAYALPHPPLAVPDVGKGKESGIAKTIEAFAAVSEDIAAIAPETIIYITPHGTVYSDYFHISPGKSAKGDFGRFNARKAKLETVYDEELAEEITRIAKLSGIPAGMEGERDINLDHGVMVPMWYINKKFKDYKTIRISQSGLSKAEHYVMGQILSKAAKKLGRKAILIGSADLSHKLATDGPYGFAPEGPDFDKAVTDAIASGDFLSLLKIPEKTRDGAGECGYNSLMVIAGAFDGRDVDANLISYEGPFGVGYAVASFSFTGSDEIESVLEKYLNYIDEEVNLKRNLEDDYQKLARSSLEHIIKTGEILPVPNDLPEVMLKEKAGVFVSMHINGKLRGCIGTIAPTTGCIAEEIIQNAISAGLSDSRFPQVNDDELNYITYKVDVLKTPERISGSEELDVKKYGVIVTSGMKRGLLLPNLDGVDTVEEQIDIARSKGGISKYEPVKLERFEVVRHE